MAKSKNGWEGPYEPVTVRGPISDLRLQSPVSGLRHRVPPAVTPFLRPHHVHSYGRTAPHNALLSRYPSHMSDHAGHEQIAIPLSRRGQF